MKQKHRSEIQNYLENHPQRFHHNILRRTIMHPPMDHILDNDIKHDNWMDPYYPDHLYPHIYNRLNMDVNESKLQESKTIDDMPSLLRKNYLDGDPNSVYHQMSAPVLNQKLLHDSGISLLSTPQYASSPWTFNNNATNELHLSTTTTAAPDT